MRLNLYIAKSGCASRRKADQLIKNGQVKVNNETVIEPFRQISEQDEVALEGRSIKPKACHYYILNKPYGVTTTLKDKHALRLISEYFPKNDLGLYPVGRLDKDSCGLIIITNDGDFCHKLTHPKFVIEKEYEVKLSGIFGYKNQNAAKIGVIDKDERLKIKSLKIISQDSLNTHLRVMITEGKKRHLRRFFKQLGFNTIDLKRIRIGKLFLKDLRPGQWLKMEKETISRLVFAV